MGLSRSLLLWCSQNKWMKENVPNYKFVKNAVKRFMPGESLDEAIEASKSFHEMGINNVFTYLGENISDLNDACEVTNHYLDLLDRIKSNKLPIEISLKLTHIGFDFSFDKTFDNFFKLASKAKEHNNFVWIDMEQNSYVDRTIEFYSKLRKDYDNIGLCMQAYLYRTQSDIEKLSELSPHIRLVKGAYKEPENIAFPKKSDVDENYFKLIKLLLKSGEINKTRTAVATHDKNLISKIEAYAKAQKINKDRYEFHLLYGVKSDEQIRLAKEGQTMSVLISYGDAWYSWYVRRLAERPANIGFVLRNIFTN